MNFKIVSNDTATTVGGNATLGNTTEGGLIPQAQDNINSVFTSLVVNGAIGFACALGFFIFRSFMKQYQLRMHVPHITVKPPYFATSGPGRFIGWLKPVLSTSDAFVLRAAGLDALVLQKAHALGVQMFLPMAVVACCLLLPLQIKEAYIQGDSSYGRVTMANIKPGSAIMWAHWVSTFCFLGWIFMLLEYHTRQYAAVRQHYLRGGDDPNYWRDLHASEADGTHVHKGAKLLDVLGAARFEEMLEQEEELLEATVKSRHWWQRAMRHLTSWTGEEDVERAAVHQAGSRSQHVDLAHDVIQGDFVRDAPPGGEAGEEGQQQEGANGPPDGVILTVPDSQGGAPPAAQAAGGRSPSPAPDGPGGASRRQPSRCPSRHEAILSEQVQKQDRMVAHKWWTSVDLVATADGRMRRLTSQESSLKDAGQVMLAKPSVRYRKTVNTYDRHGHRVSVNAQQYAVLVTNVNQPCYPEFREGPRVPGAHTCGSLSKTAIPPQVKFELEGELKGHAEAVPASSRAGGPPAESKAGPVAEGRGGGGDLEAPGDGSGGGGGGPARSGAELWALARHHWRARTLAALGRSQGYSLVGSIFSGLFPDDFDRVVPVFNFRRVDLLMRRWDVRQARLERATFALKQTGKRPVKKDKKKGEVDVISSLEGEIAVLERTILAERDAALKYGQTPSWFVLFRSQKAAAIASSCNILPMNQDLFQVHPAPGPEEVNWEALWFNHRQRVWRGWLTTPCAAVLVLLPVSLLTSAISSLNSQFCAAVKWQWYCGSSSVLAKVLRGLLTGFLPSLLIILWQGLAMPRLVYLIAQSEGRHLSLSAVDRRMGEIYFFWDIFNMFAQGVLGSAAVSTAAGAAVFSQSATFLNKPEQVPTLLGQSLPASSKFFFTYVIMRTLMTVPLRFLITQPGVWQSWLRLLDLFPPCSGPKPERTVFMRHAIRSPRYGVEFGSSLLIMLICCAFSIISPLMLLFGTAFFGGMWLFWRYQLIYNYQRKYEAGGIMWQFFVNRILICTAVMVAFTGCVLIVKRAFVQATLLWVAGFIFIGAFQHRLNRRYMNAIAEMPLLLAQMAPRARVPPTTYVPPPLQANGLGWYPEFNKVWEWFGMPGYSW